MIYSKLTKNYIAWSMLSSLSTSPTAVLTKFESDRNNLLTASSNSPSTKGLNNESNPWCEKNADENCDLEPLLLVQRYVDLDDAWNVQNDAYVALWQDAINKRDDEEPDEVEVHWGPTDDKLTKENLTIVEGEGTFTDPFIFQSRPLEQRLSSPLPPPFTPHTVKRGEEASATNPSIPPLGSDVYDPQVALAQWADDGDSTIQNLVALANIVSPPITPLTLVLCAVCNSDLHHTPDCSQFICFECEVSQPGHYPADCPDKSPSVYYDALDT